MKNIFTKLFAGVLLTFSLVGMSSCKEETPAVHEHVIESGWKSDATSHWHSCEGCDEKFDLEEHKYGDWEITKEPTCAEDGLKEKTCEVCNYKITEKIPKTENHQWGDWEVSKAATCKEEGLEKRTCAVCGKEETRKTEKLKEHIYGEWVLTKEPTCDEDGEETKTCISCGETQTRPVDKLGHKFGSVEIVKEPTVDTTGKAILKCARDETHIAEVTLPQLHSLNYLARQEGICTSGLKYIFTLTNNDCLNGTIFEGSTEAFGALSKFTYTVVTTPSAHPVHNLALINKPTLSSDGKFSVTCTDCNHTYEIIVPALSLRYYDMIGTPSSNGLVTYRLKADWLTSNESLIENAGTTVQDADFIKAIQDLLETEDEALAIELMIDQTPRFSDQTTKIVVRETSSLYRLGELDLPSVDSKNSYYSQGQWYGENCRTVTCPITLTATGIEAVKNQISLPEVYDLGKMLTGVEVMILKPSTQETIDQYREDHILELDVFNGGQGLGRGFCKFICRPCNKYFTVNFDTSEIFTPNFNISVLLNKYQTTYPSLRMSELSVIKNDIEALQKSNPQLFTPVQ